MTHVIPCSVSFSPGTDFKTRKRCLTQCSSLGRYTKQQTLSSQRLAFSLTIVIPQFISGYCLHRVSRIQRLSVTGTDVAVEEQDSQTVDEEFAGAPKVPSASDDSSEVLSIKTDESASPDRAKRSRPVRRSEMPPVKNEDLVPGPKFTGKVKSIQPFGAFVDIGAFTNGLVHVSMLSDSFVKDVGKVVSIGQEVEVRLVEVNTESRRISLSMRENDDKRKLQQRKDAASDGERSRAARKNTSRPDQRKDEVKKESKFTRGQNLKGTVKNLNRSGAFIALPEGNEGYLPASEEADDGFPNLTGGSSLEIGQGVDVLVLRITIGQVTLTMREEENAQMVDAKLNQGVVHEVTNPFSLAFRQNKDIAAFLDEKEKQENATQVSDKPETSEVVALDQAETLSGEEVTTAVDCTTDNKSNVTWSLGDSVEILEETSS